MKRIFPLFILGFCASLPLLGSTLSHRITPEELQTIVATLGAKSSVRPMRTAEAYPSWPGIKLGFEVTLVPKGELNTIGDGTGSVPDLNPVPRIYFAKGLFGGLEIIIEYFPNSVDNTINTSGGILKWTFYDEREDAMSGALFAGYTKVNALDNQYVGSNVEIGAMASKDYVRMRPYLGAGLIFASGTIFKNYMLNNGNNSANTVAIHFFGGLEYELPTNLSFQIDFMNFSPAFTFFVGKKF